MRIRTLIAGALIVAAGFLGVRYFAGEQGSGVATGEAMAEVMVPELTGEAKAGEAIFNARCATCHGANAAGQNGVAPPLVHIIYEPNHHSDAAFHLATQRGVRSHHWPFGDMPPVEGVGEADVEKILAYVRTLQRANGIH